MNNNMEENVSLKSIADLVTASGTNTDHDESALNNENIKSDDLGELSNGAASTEDPTTDSFADVEDLPNVADNEERFVQLVRDENSSQATSKAKKKKPKSKKDNSTIVPYNFEYKDKPKGFSTFTEYVGQIEDCPPPVSVAEPQHDLGLVFPKTNGFAPETVVAHFNNAAAAEDNIQLKRLQDKVNELEDLLTQKDIQLESLDQAYQSKDIAYQSQLDENSRLKSQNKTLSAQRAQLLEQNESMTTKISSLESNTKSESRKVLEERDKLREKVQHMQKDLADKEDAIASIQIEKTAFIQRIRTLEKEKKELEKAPKPVNTAEDRNRAVCAELTVVMLQKNFESDVLERALKDAESVVAHLETIISKCPPEDAVAARKYQEKFKTIVVKFKSDVDKMKKEFDDQIEKIKNGVQLSTLKRIEPPRPPTPPPLLELKCFRAPVPTAVAAPTAPAHQTHMFSARSAGEIYRPPFVTPDNRMGGHFGPIGQPYFGPPQMPSIPNNVMDGSAGYAFRPPTMGQQPIAPTHSGDCVPKSDYAFNRDVIMPRPPLSHATGGALPPRPPMHAEMVPPGLNRLVQQQQPIGSNRKIPEANSNAFSSAKGNKFHQSNLSSGLDSFLRRNPDPSYFNDGALVNNSLRIETNSANCLASSATGGGGAVAAASAADSLSSTKDSKPNASKLQQIIEYFVDRFPNAKSADVKDSITTYRSALPQKNLQGITMGQLKSGIEPILMRKFGAPTLPRAPSSNSTRASSVVDEGPYRPSEPHSPDDEPDCFICFEPKSSGNLQVLECGHEAHKECLEKWISDNKTCPMCRKWTLNDNDYPRL